MRTIQSARAISEYDPIHWHFWREDHRRELEKVQSFSELGDVVNRVIRDSGNKVHLLSAPMTSGGKGNGNKAINIKIVERMTEHLWTVEELRLLSHHPFETVLDRLHAEWKARDTTGGYCYELMEKFYGKILTPDNIEGMHFTYNWGTSKGASWEHDRCGKVGIPIHYRPQAFSDMIIQKLHQEGISLTE
jgi:hypothetical protein